jgi:hypothetical protein
MITNFSPDMSLFSPISFEIIVGLCKKKTKKQKKKKNNKERKQEKRKKESEREKN